MTSLTLAIIMGSVIVSVSLFSGLMAIANELLELRKMLRGLCIDVNHYTKSEQEGDEK